MRRIEKMVLLMALAVGSFSEATSATQSLELTDGWQFRHGGGEWEKVEVPHDWAIAGPFDLKHDRQTVRIVENGEEKASDKVGRTGELRVKTWRKGLAWADEVVRTAGNPVHVGRKERRFGDLTFVTLTLEDGSGNVCPHTDRLLEFSVGAGARLVALCNGDPTSREDFRGDAMRTFHGLLLAIVEGDARDLAVTADGI